MAKFTISVDSCVDRFASYLRENNIYCIRLKRITNAIESSELYDSFDEYEQFYKSIKKGALPTTSQLNTFELAEHFSDIFSKESEGDIVHISLSSGLSSTYDNSVMAANELNSSSSRRVYSFDSLSATLGIALLLDRLIEFRDSGMEAREAVEQLETVRANISVALSLGNLFHLRRGGRISGVKATIGTLLGVRPVLTINKLGKLEIERTIKGAKKSVAFLVDRLNTFVKKHKIDYTKLRVYVMHSSCVDEYAHLCNELTRAFPSIQLVEGMIGPIIGTHVGEGSFGIVFENARENSKG